MNDPTTPRRKPVPKRVRFEVFRRDGHACRYCGAEAPDAKLTIDHVVPNVLGGSDDPSNLVTACSDCNAGKSSSLPTADHVADVSESARAWAAAMSAAAAIERAERNAVNPVVEHLDAVWSTWSCGGNPVPRSKNWAATALGYVAAGLDESDVEYAVGVAMGYSNVRVENKWAYFCGVCRTMLEKRAAIAAKLTARDAGS